MSEPKIYYFKKGHATVMGVLTVFAMIFIPLAAVWGLWTGQPSTSPIILTPVIWFIGVYSLAVLIRPCFPTGVALELHKYHLVIASENGLNTIPKSAILAVDGVANAPARIMMKPSYVELIVPAEYKIRNWYGARINPRFNGIMVKGPSPLSIVSDISWWLADR